MTFIPESRIIDNRKPIELIPLVCQTCGNTGSDVIIKKKYIGGKGMVDVIQCKNEVECAKRWDKNNE